MSTSRTRSPRRQALILLVSGTAAVVVLALAAVGAIRLIAGVDLAGSPSTNPLPQPSGVVPSVPPPRSPTPSPVRTAAPESDATPPHDIPNPPGSPVTGLKRNALYNVDLAAGAGRCEVEVRRPKPPLANAELAGYLRTVVDCLVEVFDEPLEHAGFTLTTPKVRTYRSTIDSPCGKFGSDGPPAVYCPLSQTIYWPRASDDGREAYTFVRLGYVALAAHEFGHHLQAITGIATEFGRDYYESSSRQRLLLTRRMELQAQCIAGVFLRYAEGSLDLTSSDLNELRQMHSFTGDEDPPAGRRAEHGSSKAQIFWLSRGLDGANFGRCNTWSAPQKRVT